MKISGMIHSLLVLMLYFQNALAYFDTPVSYESKMFIKLTPDGNGVRLVVMEASNQ